MRTIIAMQKMKVQCKIVLMHVLLGADQNSLPRAPSVSSKQQGVYDEDEKECKERNYTRIK